MAKSIYILSLIAVFLFFTVESTAQIEKKSNFSFGIGKPMHPDMDIDEKGLLLALNYRHNLTRFFNWSVFLHRTTANSELDFFDDKDRLIEYVNSSELFGIATDWNSIETYSLGLRLHFPFINNSKHYFSISGAYGFYTSKSTGQGFSEVTTTSRFTLDGEFIDSMITDVVTAERSAVKTEPFIMPALEYHYTFNNDYSVGIEANFLLDQDSEGITTHPVLANYYSFSLLLGKRF